MDREAVLTSMLWLPKEGLSRQDIRTIKRDCIITYKEYGERETNELVAYRETKNYYVVPRHYGLKLMPELDGVIDFEDRTARGEEAFKGIKPIKLLEGQGPWVESALSVIDSEYDFIGQAATGKGKTVMSTEIARRLGVTTLVIVDQENLIEQWREDTWRKIFKIPESQIGFIRGKECDYEGKSIVIGMLQSFLARRDKYPREMFRYFGTVIIDEVHGVAAPYYHELLTLFPATVRFGVTATPKKGVLKKLTELHLDKGASVQMEEKHNKSIVRYIESEGVYSWYANISPKEGRFLAEISVDTMRNLLIVDAIEWLLESGRDTLIIGARIEQLETLMAMCELRGIPLDIMGLYTGRRHIWKYIKDATPKRKPYHIEPGAPYTPVILAEIEKKNSKDVLNFVKEHSAAIFATYSMFAKGVNVPRLSAGIDVTPRSKAQQVHGRILRSTVPKKIPIWVTVRDVNSFRAEYQFLQRLPEYKASNAEVFQWQIGKGVRKANLRDLQKEVDQRIHRLKAARIEARGDGRSTIQTPATGTA